MLSQNTWHRLYYYAVPVVGITAIWFLYNWPAAVTEWWAQDDYPLLTVANNYPPLPNKLHTFVVIGRPTAAIYWLFKYWLIQLLPSVALGNVVVRMIQIGTHIATAFLIGETVARLIRNRIGLLSVLPFLLWPFSGEATYWIAAGTYPLSALMSVVGILCVLSSSTSLPQKCTGFAFLFLSTTVTQSGWQIGAILMIIIMLLQYDHENEELYAVNIKMFAWITAVILVGGLLGYYMSRPGRVVPVSQWLSPDRIWSQIIANTKYLLWHPYLYPTWLSVAQIALPASAIATVLAGPSGAKTGARGVLHKGTKILLLLSILPASRFVNLIITNEAIPPRLMYPASLLFTASVALMFQSKFIATRLTVIMLLCIMMIGYFPISITNAREHVTVYNSDRSTLMKLESAAKEQGVDTISFPDQKRRKPIWNPYHLKYLYGLSKISAFQGWPAPYLLSAFSTSLVISSETKLVDACSTFCVNNAKSDRLYSVVSASKKTLCFCL